METRRPLGLRFIFAAGQDTDGRDHSRSIVTPPYSLLPIRHSLLFHCRRLSLAAAAAGGAGCEAWALLLLLLAPNRTRVGLRSKLFTARLMSDNVLRPSVI